MKSLRTRLAPAALIASAVFAAPLVGSGGVTASPIDQKRDEVALITDQLEAMEERRDILTEQLTVASDELKQLEADVATAQAAVEAQQAEVNQLQSELGDVAVRAFIGGGANGLGPMLGDSTSINSDLVRDEMSRAALTAGTATSDDLSRELNQLAEDEADLQERQQAAADKREQVEAAKEAAEDKAAEYQTARAEAEAELGTLIQEEEERRARESYERMLREAEAAQARAAAQQQQQAQAQQQASSARPSAGSNSSSGSNTASGNQQSSGGSQQQSSGGGQAAVTPAPATPAVPQASSRAGTAVNAAMGQQGTPYRYAAASPGVAFDCSGLTSWAWAQAGVYLPHQSAQQAAMLPKVDPAAAQPGDLVFFYSPISHVGIYLGGGMMVHAPNSGSVVKTSAVNWGNVTAVGRPG